MKTPFLTFVNWKNSTITNNTFKLVLFTLLTVFICASCSEDEDTTPQQQEEEIVPDGEALSQLFLENRQEAIQTFVIDGESGAVITGELGTTINIAPNAFTINGIPVSGDVSFELVEIYSKGQMLLNNMPTNGKRPNGDIEMIKSAGEFYINATQNGTQLQLEIPLQLFSKPIEFADVDNDMGVFIVGCDDPLDFTCTEAWEEDEFTQVGLGEVQGPNGEWMANYIVNLSSFGWTNLDRWYNFNGELTTLNIDVPEEYNGNNCEVYLSYDGETSGLARMDVYDEQTGMFTEHFGKIPVGQDVHIILIAEINGVLHYTIQPTIITQNHVEIMAEPQAGTEAELLALIEALP